jgi:hypothetical protein
MHTGKDAALGKCTIAIVIGLAFAWLGSLASMRLQHLWMLVAQGKPIFTDFLEAWVAGRTALHGAAAAAHNLIAHRAAQVTAAVGAPILRRTAQQTAAPALTSLAMQVA